MPKPINFQRRPIKQRKKPFRVCYRLKGFQPVTIHMTALINYPVTFLSN